MRKIFFLLFIGITVLIACNNSDTIADFELISSETSVILEQDQLREILDMIDYLRRNESSTRTSTTNDEPVPGTGHRVYMTWWWCSGSGGNCLPDVIITNPERSNSSDYLLNTFLTTEVGELLNSYVELGELKLDVHNNEKIKTSFLTYSNSTDTNKSMVIPLVHK